ncbi:MAG: outer rane autotransporter barrel domain protein [Pseudonocardiales bacterium]|nr:outer rane autotransporter barrel domain protein [Pseudonocardiales bacterium]
MRTNKTMTPSRRGRGFTARLAGLGAAGFAATLVAAPLAHGDATSTPSDPASDTGTPTPTDTASATPTDTGSPTPSGSASSSSGQGTPSTSAGSPTSHPATSSGSAPAKGATGAAKARTAPAQSVPQVALPPNYGAQKIRVGIQTKDGAYYPPGASLAGAVITAVETGPLANDQAPNGPSCTTDATGFCAFAVPGMFGGYLAAPGDTVTFTQTTAPIGPGILRDTLPEVVGPCLFGFNVLNAAPSTLAVAASPTGLPTCGILPPLAVAAQSAAHPQAITSDQFGPIVTFVDPGVPPVAVNDTSAVAVGHTVTVPVITNDTTGGAPATITASSPSHGTAVVSGTGIKYTPAAGFFGTDSFKYTITTANGAATATVTVKVTAPPLAADDTAHTVSGTAVHIAVLGNDLARGGVITLASVGAAGHGTATIDGTSIVYTPAADFAGTDAFTYTITTANGSSSATVTVTVTAPVLSDTGGLASTGTPSEQLLGAGALLVLAGGAVTVAGRRRRARA